MLLCFATIRIFSTVNNEIGGPTAYKTLTSCLNAFYFNFVYFLAVSSCCGASLTLRGHKAGLF